ncbi:hypothetical protein V6N12_066236 [Hibiscus sabdariffa]|uniref:Helicase ATP-binding domain-containing protein n=1 Tax=Hibiscus sabdariffa TaxID=183260 RepID=A0ABR2AR47_9ROSI
MEGDNESYSIKNIQQADIILTTPEKFDAVTRYHMKNGGLSFFSDIALLLIDEVHLLNDLRGAALEAIVSRIKMLSRNPEMKSSALASVRFLAVSATIRNIEDLVGYHNGGLSLKDRNLIEGLFLSGDVLVLCTTNTLAHGINLPAHTVVIKSTQHFNREKGLYMEYDRSMVLQTDQDGFVLKPQEPGRLMTKYYLKFNTMKHIMQAPSSCSLEDVLRIICHAEEIACMYAYLKLWDDSPFLLKQLPGIGMVTAKALHSMGIKSFETLAEADPRRIEIITGRKFPFGNHIKESLTSLPPKVDIKIEVSERQRQGKSKLAVTLTRLSSQGAQSTKRHYGDMIVASEEENLVLFHEKIRLSFNLLDEEPGEAQLAAGMEKDDLLDPLPQSTGPEHISDGINNYLTGKHRITSGSSITIDLTDELGDIQSEPETFSFKRLTEETILDHIRKNSKNFPVINTSKVIESNCFVGTEEHNSENQPGFGNATLGASKDAMVISELENSKHLADLGSTTEDGRKDKPFPSDSKRQCYLFASADQAREVDPFLGFRSVFSFL